MKFPMFRNEKVARFVSAVGHPLVTVPFVVIYILFWTQPLKNAFFISSLVIGLIQIPVLIHLSKKFKKKEIEGFDVSNRKQRKKFYFFVVPLLILVNLILYFTDQPKDLISGFLFAAVLILMMQVLNYYIKSSLHVAVNVYLGFLLFGLNPSAGIFWWIFVLIIGWSRLELKKHTTREVVCGFLMGTICGSALTFLN